LVQSLLFEMIVDLWSRSTKLSRNRLVGHVPQKDLTNNVMDQNKTCAPLRFTSTYYQRPGASWISANSLGRCFWSNSSMS
jgi:hypothetical protein